jgi:hypothetical protein
MRLGCPSVLNLTSYERVRLDSLAHRSRTAPHLARRAQIILACAEGAPNKILEGRPRNAAIFVQRTRLRIFAADKIGPGAPPETMMEWCRTGGWNPLMGFRQWDTKRGQPRLGEPREDWARIMVPSPCLGARRS